MAFFTPPPLITGKKKGGGVGKQRVGGANKKRDSDVSEISPSNLAKRLKSAMSTSKRLRSTVSNISKHLICPITQELMVDPVLAEDGHTYERASIIEWLTTKSTSPLDSGKRLDVSRLMTNRAVKEQIEELVESGELDDALCAGYLERKESASLEHAQELYDEGKVEEAAELGLPKAQGIMADRFFHGKNGVTQDSEECVEWAKRAAAGGDEMGQFRLGVAYHRGHGGLAKDWELALTWYEKAAEQGCQTSMVNLGRVYFFGGHGVAKNEAAAVNWYRRAAKVGDDFGQLNLARCYYNGQGVDQSLRKARRWLEKSADQGHADALCALGIMLVKGEGGARDVSGGMGLWEEAAAKGHEEALGNLQRILLKINALHFDF